MTTSLSWLQHREMVMPTDENARSLETNEAITGSLLDAVTIRLGRGGTDGAPLFPDMFANWHASE